MNDLAKFRIPDEKLAVAVRAAYDLSSPQGMGFLHHVPGSMSADDATTLLHNSLDPARGIHLDYVAGRAVKLSIRKDEEGYFVYDNGRWYDHSPEQWEDFKYRVSMAEIVE